MTRSTGLDADFDEVKGTVTYRAETDKQGESPVLPLFPFTRELLAIARPWRARLEYTRPYLLPPGSALSETPPLTIQAIGDRDIKMAKHYAVTRKHRIDRALTSRVAGFEPATELQPSAKSTKKRRVAKTGDNGVSSSPSTTLRQ